jgi:transposase
MDIAQEAPQTVIVAEDEASLYLQATTQRVWAPKGQTPAIRVHPGRECTHFFGTLDLRTGTEIALRTDTMNAVTTAQHLEQVLNAFPDVPILLLWDKAPWHRGEPIRKLLAEHPRLDVMCFPTASPDLNPQEHVWKAVRSAISHNHLELKLDALAVQFEHHLNSHSFSSSFLDSYGFIALSAMFT